MRPDLPWNVAGVPPEAREAARAAARREGLSVGEWLTRRILRSLAETNSTPDDDVPSDWRLEPADDRPSERGSEVEVHDRPQRREFDAEGAYRRIEEELHKFVRRIETTERNQSEHNRAMNKVAAETNAANRGNARVADELAASVTNLSHRIERVERQAPAESLRDAVRGLHQGLTRVADQLSNATSHSADQVSALADRLEGIAERLGQAKLDSDSLARRIEGRATQLDERIDAVERRIETDAGDAARAAENALVVARLEETLARVEARTPDPALDRRLNSIERAIADVSAHALTAEPRRTSLEDQMRVLLERVDSGEKRQRELVGELREAIASIPHAEVHDQPAAVAAEPEGHPATAVSRLEAPNHPAPDAPKPEDSPPAPSSIGASAPTGDNFPHNAPKPSDVPEAIVHPIMAAEPASTFPENQPQAPNEPLSLLHDSFLAAARRSAQTAAAQAEAERAGGGFGGFAWNTRAEPAKRKSPRFGLVGVAALAVIALGLAGVLLTHRLATLVPLTHGSSAKLTDKSAAPRSVRRNAADRAPSVQVRVGSVPSVSSPGPRTVKAPPASSPDAPGTNSGAAAPERLAAVDAHAITAAGAPNAQSVAAAKPAPARPGPSVAALDRLTALANLGNAKAETIVGLRYLDGDGTPPNESEAAKWLARAAEHGEAVAQYRLGTLYEHGRGVPADSAKALHWYQAAAQAGNRKAMHNLAVAYAQGTGVPKDFFEAARWFSKAAALGLADSQFNLAVLYERGLGVPQSLIDAYKWYAIAAAQGDGESKARIDAIATQLSTDDRAAAQRSADQFRPARLNAATNVPPQLNDIAG